MTTPPILFAAKPSCLQTPTRARLAALLLITGLGTHAGLLYAAAAQGNAPLPAARPVYDPLNEAQLNQIQAIGRVVLAAKGGQQVSSEELALQSDLHNLAASVDQALRISQPSISLTVAGAAGSTTHSQSGTRSTRRAGIDSQINAQLANLHQHRQNIDALIPGGDEARQQRIEHVQQLSRQAAPLEQSVQDALAEPDDAQRITKLADLKQKLRSRSLGQWWQDREKDARLAGKPSPLPPTTPTMTTLTHHRAGLDDVGASSSSPPKTTHAKQSKR